MDERQGRIADLEAKLAALESVVQFLLIREVDREADPVAALRQLDGFLRDVAHLDGGAEQANVALDILLEPVTAFAVRLRRQR